MKASDLDIMRTLVFICTIITASLAGVNTTFIKESNSLLYKYSLYSYVGGLGGHSVRETGEVSISFESVRVSGDTLFFIMSIGDSCRSTSRNAYQTILELDTVIITRYSRSYVMVGDSLLLSDYSKTHVNDTLTLYNSYLRLSGDKYPNFAIMKSFANSSASNKVTHIRKDLFQQVLSFERGLMKSRDTSYYVPNFGPIYSKKESSMVMVYGNSSVIEFELISANGHNVNASNYLSGYDSVRVKFRTIPLSGSPAIRYNPDMTVNLLGRKLNTENGNRSSLWINSNGQKSTVLCRE